MKQYKINENKSMFYKASSFHVGMKIIFKLNPYEIIKVHYHKPGKGASIVKTRLKNLLNKTIILVSFRTGDKVEQASLYEKRVKFLYKSEFFVFEDINNFDIIHVNPNLIKDNMFFLKKDIHLTLTIFNDNPIGLMFDKYIALKVIKCDHESISAKTKKAVLETKLICEVPHFIKKNDMININTDTNLYTSKNNEEK